MTSPIPAARFNLAMFRARRAQDYRCSSCGRKLAELICAPGMLASIKCPKCGGYNTVDVPLNSTSAPVLVEFLDHLNGSTPPSIVDAVARFVLRNGPVSEQEPGSVPSVETD